MEALQHQRRLLDACELAELFIEHLGWDRHQAQMRMEVDGHPYELTAFAHKRGFTALTCSPGRGGRIPDFRTRALIDQQVTKSAREHIIIYLNADRSEQLWQWVRRAPDQRIARREYTYRRGQRGGMLLERVLPSISFTLAEEESLSLVDVTARARAAFDVEKVTKRFYDRFKAEHEAFRRFLAGIPDESLQSWYVSVMLNRLMFIYFIQKKRFLDDDPDYLRNRLALMRKKGKDRYYREFLCPLFFEGFAKRPEERSPAARQLLGTVPYLNGGLFLKHQIEEQHGATIQIPDAAFERLFQFFDAYRWHLDERPLRANNEINPDVLGYIFEKYVNQKQMGAYYTKEDITEYISKNTIIPFLFDAARKECAIAFKPDGAVWRLLRDDPDRYIYPAVRHGVIRPDGSVLPESDLPDFVQKGMKDPKARMFDKRFNLQQAPAGDPVRLVTETWREYMYRRNRCLEIRQKLQRGEIHEINDLITLNLDIRQFAEDVIATSEGPELVRAFWKAIERVTVLDPACGSGAFLFAALNILEPLYEACLNRMQGFLDDLARDPGSAGIPPAKSSLKFSDFRKVLERVAEHPNHRYFVLKSIIVNNLFGVDIMEEATEICKLRLFLKLVAQIDRPDQIEPLPDIDFNIRAGNTLVGFATLDEVRRAVTQDAKNTGQGLIQFDDTLSRLEEQARLVDTAFRKFREMQTDQGVTPAELAKGKEMVRSRMTALDAQLDRYLAAEYGVSAGTIPDKKKYEDAFQKWRKSHEPFHWFVDCYGIMTSGGFDVAIGNPPYVEISDLGNHYSLRGLALAKTGNLYAPFVERFVGLLGKLGRFGVIVPVSSISTPRMTPFMTLIASRHTVYASSFAVRPGKLFNGVDMNLTIILGTAAPQHGEGVIRTTGYNRWLETARPTLFETLRYGSSGLHDSLAAIPKIGSCDEASLLAKLMAYPRITRLRSVRQGDVVYYHSGGRYFRKCLRRKPSNEYKELVLEAGTADAVLAILSSSLYYWLWITFSDCYHVTSRDVDMIPVPDTALRDSRLRKLAAQLLEDLEKNAEVRLRRRADGTEQREVNYYVVKSKAIIDEIDRTLAGHYGLTDCELDFLINHDGKFRSACDDN